jgi:hypothetical protein
MDKRIIKSNINIEKLIAELRRAIVILKNE